MVHCTADQALEHQTEYSIHPSGGGYLPPVTPGAVTSLGLPPNVL
jgi:hypothetical protein